MKKVFSAVLALLFVLALLSGCSSKPAQKNIAFADVGWDSIRLQNAAAGLIATTLFGYDSTSEVSGSTPITHEALIKGEIDVHMEVWTDNISVYDQDLKEGRFQEMGVNFDDNGQGLYVPRYVIEGDAQRGIAPVAPDLRTVKDLKNYASVFKDSEDPSKGRIYGGIPGWEVDEIMHKKYLAYALDQNFNYFRPGTDAAMSAELISAYDKGVPIVAYYWEPTWLLGKYDFVLLEDEPYDPVLYMEGKTACPSVSVTIGTSNRFAENNPAFCAFLKNYHTTSALLSEALAYMQDTQANYEQAARWMMTTHPELLDEWLTAEQATEMKQALGMESASQKINPLIDFPIRMPVNTEAIDSAVRGFSVRHSVGFETVKKGLTAMVGLIRTILNLLPWWLLIALVFFLGKTTSGNWIKGLIYALMLFLIGLFGLWSLMLETLAIVMSGVLLSLLIGLPIGVLISGSDRANRIIRPVLDTMQTMPVFVYLIPAVLFFGMGSAPAVIATVIYAVVPVIRLTSLGIRQVDREVVEAAKSFGSTRMQALFKVQIPQALPTIMTGINQTMMMAMAMVVTCSMIGAQGIGNEVLIAVNRTEISRGLINGTAVVILAVLMDRLTQGWFSRGGKH